MQPLTSDDPATIGGYRLEARLGSGGMGRVYLAFTPAGRPVALKVVRSDLSDDQDFRIRFEQEIQAARRVRGLYTAELIDADPAASPPWLVTAYVPGPSVEEVIDRDGPMPEATVFRLVAGVAEALQAIHGAGVIHRDLKPSNVLLAPDGPRVIDFGIARALAATPMTRTGASMGSPDYMSPEQILNRPVTPAIDVFALGSLAAFAAVGRLPFGRGHITDVAHRVVREPPDLAGCPAGLVTLIEACLQKEPQARPLPGQIIEFCVARAALLGDAGLPRPALLGDTGQPRPALLGDTSQPRPVPVPAGGTPAPSAWSAGSATVALDRARLAGRGRPRRPRISLVTVLAIVAGTSITAAAVLVAIAATSHPGAGRTVAASASAAAPRRSVVARAPVPPHPVVLLSQGRPVTASSVQPDTAWVPANAVDGDTGTRWSSAYSDPQWLEVDLGAAHPITKVVLDWETAYAVAFQIQVSDDGSTWTDLYSTTTGTGSAQTLPVSGTGRYVRMYGTQRGTQWGYSLWEFQIYGR
jgi:eukaryotic-like serine/threonine-protein kinase